MRVLISGAGIAGPTLAWFLVKAGARITIVEKSRTLLPHGQNVDIQGSALAVIKMMGLVDQIRRFNTTERGTSSFTSEFEILRGDLAAILHQATKDIPNFDYRFDTTIRRVVSNDDSTVKVELSYGEVQEFDLLVAADGQWSKVRKQCFSPEHVNVVHLGMYVVHLTIPRLSSDNDWWNTSVKDRVARSIQKRRTIQEELVRKEFADAGWLAQRLLDGMAQAPDFYFQVVQRIKMSKWSSSRIVCLGDAAHAPTPLTGMGTSLALTGAYVLAGELAKLDEGKHPLKALESYEKTFRPFVEEMQKIPFVLPAIVHPETAWKRWIFQTCVSTLSTAMAIPWVASRFPDESNEGNFPLPEYPRLQDKCFS
ncbi:hypothetical protein MMC13_004523 [Lambiella insularis]|nr:hypothetical protein [Lambiella insularis]